MGCQDSGGVWHVVHFSFAFVVLFVVCVASIAGQSVLLIDYVWCHLCSSSLQELAIWLPYFPNIIFFIQ